MIDQSTPQTGSSNRCPHCGIAKANEHSLAQSAKCDGIKSGKVKKGD